MIRTRLGDRDMPRVSFTQNLQRHIACEPESVAGNTVAEALAAVFSANPKLRSYVLDDLGGVRKHIAIYVNNETIADRNKLSDPVNESDEVYVMQALSGG